MEKENYVSPKEENFEKKHDPNSRLRKTPSDEEPAEDIPFEEVIPEDSPPRKNIPEKPTIKDESGKRIPVDATPAAVNKQSAAK